MLRQGPPRPAPAVPPQLQLQKDPKRLPGCHQPVQLRPTVLRVPPRLQDLLAAEMVLRERLPGLQGLQDLQGQQGLQVLRSLKGLRSLPSPLCRLFQQHQRLPLR